MGKEKSTWVCEQCGWTSSRWVGQCDACRSWDIAEQVDAAVAKRPLSMKEVVQVQLKRISTGVSDIDRLLGGGIVPGSLILIGGDPGIGKSTLLLQISFALSRQKYKVLYLCGEESPQQVLLRAQRLHSVPDEEHFLLHHETQMSEVVRCLDTVAPSIIVVDSIQVMSRDDVPSSPGSVAQVREVTATLMRVAKDRGIACVIIGHVTKSGEIAGPRLLEHLVDTVAYFQEEGGTRYRLLRSIKNRFGSIDEIALLEMTEKGLKTVGSPSSVLLAERNAQRSGSAVVPAIKGSRALLVEVQALVAKTSFATPARRATGFDVNRLTLLLAVLEAKGGLSLSPYDVFLSIAGGLKIQEPALDLGVVAAVVSALNDRSVPCNAVFLGELGLSGEIRAVRDAELRLREAKHLGFRRCYLPQSSYNSSYDTIQSLEGMECVPLSHLEEFLPHLFDPSGA